MAFLKRLFGGWFLTLYHYFRSVRETSSQLRGVFYCRILDPVTGEVVEEFEIANAATTVGENSLLNVGFRGTTQITAWYVGLINGSGFGSVSSADTMASHSGWTEYTGYSESVRQTWSPGAAASGSIVNTTAMTFTNGGSPATIQGMFLASSATKSETASVLYSTAVESGGTPRSLAASAPFQINYQVVLTPVS